MATFVVTDHGGRITVRALPDGLAPAAQASAYQVAEITACREGWTVTRPAGDEDTYPRGDLGRALCHVLGRTGHPCPYCGRPRGQGENPCPDPTGHDRAHRAHENTWRAAAA